MTGRGGIEALLAVMDEAFEGRGIEASNESQALLVNLASVPEDDRRARPGGAARTIHAIALHVGACKPVYDDHAFGAARLRFGTPAAEPWAEDDAMAPDRIVAWLRVAQGRLRDHVDALADDAELAAPRLTNWGEKRPTRWNVVAMITHDADHAGEINHLRSLLSGDDRWRFQQPGGG